MKKLILFLSLILNLCILYIGGDINVNAEEISLDTNINSTFDEIKNLYIQNNLAYQRNSLILEQQLVKYEIVKERLNVPYLSGTSANEIAELELEANKLSFYKDNQNILLEDLNKEYEFNLYRQLLEVRLLKDKVIYYNTVKDYLDLVLSVEEVKLKKGRTTGDSVDEINASIEMNSADITNAISEYEDAKEEINLGNSKSTDNIIIDTYINSITLAIFPKESKINTEQLESDLKMKNTKYMELVNSINSYEGYVKTLDITSMLYKQTKLQILEYNIQLNEVEDNIEKYAKKAADEYNKVLKYQAASLKKYNVLDKKCLNIQKQYEKGRKSKLDWYEAKVKKEEERQKYLNYCYQIKTWAYIISNEIYDATP